MWKTDGESVYSHDTGIGVFATRSIAVNWSTIDMILNLLLGSY